MSFILFVLFIVIIAVLSYQSQRISKIERMLKDGVVRPASNQQAAPAMNEPAPAVAMNMNQQASAGQTEAAIVQEVEPASSEEFSGRVLGRIGIGAVVIGMAFFLKYAFDNNWIGPEGRIVLGIIIGIAVMCLGQWLRKKYLTYSDLLMGGGMAILYLSLFASYSFYHIVDPMMAFMGMIVVTAVGVILSIIDATETLSAIALIGGFLTPFLIGTAFLGPWITFTYITILNAGILGILFYRKWPPLILIGLGGTWLYFGSWLVTSYTQDLLVPTLTFVLVQFLIFTASSVIRIILEKQKATELDYAVLAATAISYALCGYYLLMPSYEHFASAGAVMTSALYFIIALVAFKENPEDRTINIFLPGLAVSFLTAAIPIEFSGSWIAAWWFVESLVLYVVASKSSSRGFQVMGAVVYVLGLFDLLWYISTYVRPTNFVPFFNTPFIMLAMATAVAYAITFIYFRYGSISMEIRQRGIMAFVVLANVITLYALTSQVSVYYDIQMASDQSGMLIAQLQNSSHIAVSILWALYAAFLTGIGFAKRYPTVRRMGLILFIITGTKVVIDVWSLGELYRIISFIVFGIIALIASFLYVKYKDRLMSVV